MAIEYGLTLATVSRIWRAFDLKSPRGETFQLSRDPVLIERVANLARLYVAPQARGPVLCVDEKSKI